MVFHWQNGEMLALYHEAIWERWMLPTAEYAVSYGISNTDHVVSTILTPSEDDPELLCQSAVLFRPAVMSDLATPYPGEAITVLASHASSAAHISAEGLYVVGWAMLDPTSSQITAFLVTPVGGRWADPEIGPCGPQNPLLKSLGTLRARDENSSATAVNNRGQVVGWSYTWYPGANKKGYAAFLIEHPNDTNSDGEPDQWFVDNGGANALMLELGTLGGHNSWARAINDAGVVIGEADTGDWLTQAFLWHPSTRVMQPLGTLGGDNSSAAGLNESGQVVGWSIDAEGDKRAFIINPRDTDGNGQPDQWYLDADGDGHNDLMTDLNVLLTSTFSVRLTEARDIDESGRIVGWGLVGSGDTVRRMAFLLTPTAASGAVPRTSSTRQDAVLEPVEAQGNPEQTDQAGGEKTGGTDTLPTFGPLHFLCGMGLTSLVPFTLLGLGGLKVALRRRRRGRD